MKHCPSCGAPIHRLIVSRADADLEYGRHVSFDQDEAGAWIRDPLYGHMRRIGTKAVTNLTRYRVHSCVDQGALD